MGHIRAGIVGCGKIARTHADALTALPGSEVVAACDLIGQRAEEFAREYGARAYSDLETMLEAEALDMVSICTPHPLHARAVCVAAEHGVSALVEKPLAPDLAGCDEAIASCRRAKVKLGVISQRRLYPAVVRVKQAIDTGKIGNPVLATLSVLGWRDKGYYNSDPWRGTWEGEGGGVLVNQTPHQLDLLQWFMGPIDELSGYWENVNHPYIPVEDTAVAVIRFHSGALASLVVSNSQNPGLWGRIYVHGSNGASVGVLTESGSSFVAGVTTKVEPPVNDIWTVPGEEQLLSEWQREDRLPAAAAKVMTYYHQVQIQDFVQAIVEDRAPMVDGEEGRKVVEMITAIYRSQRDHRPVKFPIGPETGRTDYDGRLGHVTLSSRAAL
jgi:UDP-N-acetyl-2-amino-2-deoxyglucuronate dehydrogenase